MHDIALIDPRVPSLIWQSFDIPGSKVLVTDVKARRIAKQSAEETQAEIIAIPLSMYRKDIPSLEVIVYKNWHDNPSFWESKWRTSYSFDVFRTLREPLYNRL